MAKDKFTGNKEQAVVEPKVTPAVDAQVEPTTAVEPSYTTIQEPATDATIVPEATPEEVTPSDTVIPEEVNPVQEPEAELEPVAVISEEDELVRIQSILDSSKLTIEDKLLEVNKSTVVTLAMVAGRLIDYRDQMHKDNGEMEAKAGASKNGQLYRSIMSILGNSNDTVFQVGFSLINLAFKAYSTEHEAYNIYTLARYDSGWDNQKDLSTYQKLCVVIPMLADASTREENKTKIDFDKLRDSAKTNFKDIHVNRLVSFYNI